MIAGVQGVLSGLSGLIFQSESVNKWRYPPTVSHPHRGHEARVAMPRGFRITSLSRPLPLLGIVQDALSLAYKL